MQEDQLLYLHDVMTYQDIYEIIKFIPINSRHFDTLALNDGDSYGERQEEVELFAACYRDLAFRWHFVRSYIDIDQALPDDVTDKYIRRLYNYFISSKKDPFVTMAIAIAKHMPIVTQTGLKAMLLDPNADLLMISDKLGFELPVIHIYEQLFFNVRDRLSEHAFIASVAYPDGRTGLIGAGENYLSNPTEEILRAGYNNGMEHAAYAMGLKNTVVTEDFANVAKKLENLLMSNALYLAQNGYMDTYHPGMQHAKQIIAATKQGDNEESSEEEYGVGCFGNAITEELEGAVVMQSEIREKLLLEAKKREEEV